MKRMAAIFFFSVYLFGTTDTWQIFKTPLLVIHYIKHKKENPYTTVSSFLKMHYVDPQPFDADYKQDMQLPFKTISDAFCINAITILPALPRLSFKVPAIVPVRHTLLNDEVPPYLLPHSIFQPPKA